MVSLWVSRAAGSEKIPLEKLKDFVSHIRAIEPDLVPAWIVFELAHRTLAVKTHKDFATAKEWLEWSQGGH